MNDFDYDSMQKKRIARGAMNKVRHTGCTLPHEHLTKKELKKMNGEVKKYNLTQPMKWAEFRAMPIDLQRKYIKMLQDGYHATCAMLADMFGISSKTVWSYFKDNEINTITKATALKVTHDKIVQESWKTYCNGVVGGGDSLSQVTPQEVIRNIEETGPKMIEMDFPVFDGSYNMAKIQEAQDKFNRELMEKKGWTEQEYRTKEKELLKEIGLTDTTAEFISTHVNVPEPKVEPHTLPVDKLDIVYHDVKSLSELKSLICGDITFKNPMEIKIYIREEPKKWYQNQTEKEN